MTQQSQTSTDAQALTPGQPDHIVIVVEENHDADQVVGNPYAPYINKTLLANGLYYTNAHGTDHPSQPNYLEMFAGANPGIQGVNAPLQQQYPVGAESSTSAQDALKNADGYNADQPFSVSNLGAALLAAGRSFVGYSEDQPSVGFTGQSAAGPQGPNAYVEKHNPWAQFQGSGTNQLPAETNQPLTSFPAGSDFSQLPSVSFIVPNQYNDMHNTVSAEGLPAVGTTGADKNGSPVSDDTTIQNGDSWLAGNLEAYREWASTHNSLLITTWDENDYDFTNANDIPMIVDGDPRLVQPGVNSSFVNHFDLLKTIEDLEGAQPSGLASSAGGLPSDGDGKLAPDMANEANFSSSKAGISADLITRHVFANTGTETLLSPTANAITGSAENDYFAAAPGAGNWSIDGGGGHDTLIIAADHTHAVVAPGNNGDFTVVLDGSVIQAAGIDRLQFMDGTVDFSSSGSGEFAPYGTNIASDLSGSGLGGLSNLAEQALAEALPRLGAALANVGADQATAAGAAAGALTDLQAWLMAALPGHSPGQ